MQKIGGEVGSGHVNATETRGTCVCKYFGRALAKLIEVANNLKYYNLLYKYLLVNICNGHFYIGMKSTQRSLCILIQLFAT